ncbi:MAG: hypothetical protein IKL79_02405 [Clostridia bacterium]|nr:hypothetical protein [Clostridia bacterium]
MELLYTLIILGAAVGVGSAACHGAMRGAVRGALGVLLVCSMVAPFLGAVARLENLELELPSGESETDGFTEITALAFADGVREAICDEFSIKAEINVIVRGFSPAELRADSITVVIPTSAAHVDFRAVREYTEKSFTRVGGCEVVYG